MANPQLINYIRLQTRIGTDEATIRAGLAPGGWSEDEIREAFEVVHTTPAEAVPKMPIKGEENSPIVVTPKDTTVIIPDDTSSMLTPVLFLSTTIVFVFAVLWVFIVKIPARASFGALYADDAMFRQYVLLLALPLGAIVSMVLASWISGRRVFGKEKRPVHALLFGLSVYILFTVLLFICAKIWLPVAASLAFGESARGIVQSMFALFLYPALQIALVGFLLAETLLALSLRGTIAASAIMGKSTYILRSLFIVVALLVAVYFAGLINPLDWYQQLLAV